MQDLKGRKVFLKKQRKQENIKRHEVLCSIEKCSLILNELNKGLITYSYLLMTN